MTDTFRALCAELVDAILTPNPYNWEDSLHDSANRARALLARPAAVGVLPLKERPDFIAGYGEGLTDGRRIIEREEAERPTPQPPADGEVAELVAWLQDRADSTSIAANANRASRIADLLQHQHPQPAAEGPTDEELLRLAREWNSGFESIELHFAADYARAVLDKWGHQ